MEWLKKQFPEYTTETTEPLRVERPTPEFIDWDFLDWLRKVLNIPNVQWRTFKSTYKGWHYIRFAKPYPEPPTVVAICSGFHYELPWIPSLPEWKRPDYSDIYRGRFEGWFRQVMGEWGILNWLRDALAKYFMGPLGWVVGSAVNFFWDLTLKPHADTWNREIVARFNSTLEEVHERLLGLMKGLGVTPLAVRNVDVNGCEIFAPDDTYVFMIVVGKP